MDTWIGKSNPDPINNVKTPFMSCQITIDSIVLLEMPNSIVLYREQ